MGRSASPERSGRGRDEDRRHKEDRHRRRDDKVRRSKKDRKDRSRSRTRSRERGKRHAAEAPALAVVDLEVARQQALAGRDAEEARKQEREQEAAALDEEMEKRRKRVEAWQEQRRKLQEQQAAAAAAEQQQAEAAAVEQAEEEQKQWNLEDEGDLSDSDGGGGSVNQAVENGAGEADDAKGPAGNSPTALPPLAAAAAEEEEEDPLDAFMRQNKAATPPAAPAAGPAAMLVDCADGGGGEAEEEVDALDAFMAASVLPEVSRLTQAPRAADAAGAAAPAAANGSAATAGARPGSAAAVGEPGRARPPPAKRRRRAARYDSGASDAGSSGDEDASAGAASEEEDDAEWARKLQAGKLSKGEKLGLVDHSQIRYPPFRRNFYIEVPELARMAPAEVEEARKRLDGIKVRGKDVPKPVRAWTQCGLSTKVLEVLRKAGFAAPLPIQAQALPVIMSGRDCIGIAKTGSGKTLAFVLPMIRHVKDQPPLAQGDGPVALVMAPTRELVTQIGKEVRQFARAAGLACTCVYGGSGVANQISELKRGTEIVVCTPGRMIDILATGAGKITNLRRVTYLVMDEADRMFDMGFEPQIMRMVNNVRPDRQTVMFSATFPRAVETLARQVLHNPVEIQVGGRSVVNRDITQYVELRAEGDRFLRLLEVLGEWYERGKLLIFVGSQERCDNLFRDLLRAGYPCLSLHGGKDQSDRESTIADFKSNVCNVLVATSVAARGLDVRDLVLVVNYDCPNHYEEYVHRVGRTGRAGAKGTSITFIGPDEDQYAPDLVRALKESAATVPADLAALADGFERKRKAGSARTHGSGYGGSGFKFSAAEEESVKTAKKAAAREFGIVEGSESEGEGGDDGIRLVTERKPEPQAAAAAGAAAGGGGGAAEGAPDISSLPPEVQARVRAAQAIAEKLGSGPQPPPQPPLQLPPQPPSAVPPWQLAAAAAGAPAAVPTAQVAPPPLLAANPMVAAAQAAAQQLAMQMGSMRGMQQPGMPGMPQQPGMPGMPQQPGMQPFQLPQQLQQQQQQQQQPMMAGGTSIAAAAAAALQAMHGPGGALLPGQQPAALAGAAASAAPQAPAPQAQHYEAELEINDFPQQARWKITHRDTIRDIGENIGAAIITKGRYTKPGAPLPEGERKLYLQIQAPSPELVRKAKAEIKRIVEESTEKALRRETPAGAPGRYSIM